MDERCDTVPKQERYVITFFKGPTFLKDDMLSSLQCKTMLRDCMTVGKQHKLSHAAIKQMIINHCHEEPRKHIKAKHTLTEAVMALEEK